MKHLKTIAFALLIVALSIFTLGTGTGTARSATRQASAYSARVSSAASACGVWSVVPSPSVAGQGDSSLGAVAAASTNDVWAVGNHVLAAPSIPRTLIEHWDGQTWSIVSSPDFGPYNNQLWGVSAPAANAAFAVGNYIAGNFHSQTLIEQWNGKHWSIVPSPNLGTDDFLFGVSALSASQAFAVGYYQDAQGTFHTLIESWNGAFWSVVSSPTPGAAAILQGVTSSAPDNAWAVGQTYRSNAPAQALLEHWNGSTWTVAASPDLPTNGMIFGAATAPDGTVFGAGNLESDTGPFATLTEQRTASGWHFVPSPNQGQVESKLYGVAAPASNDAWSVGEFTDNNGNAQTLIEHWDGSQWQIVASPSPGSGSNILGAVAALSAHDIWAVGGFDTGGPTLTLIEHFC